MRKYFLQDKNYILGGAQYDLKEELLSHLIDSSKTYYQQMYNPLGLLDDTIIAIQKHSGHELEVFDEFYDLLSAIFRFKYGSNQLEFLFDGMDHYSKYSIDWKRSFHEWTKELFQYDPFLKTILQLTVFETNQHSNLLAASRLKNYLFTHFNLKIYKYKGIVQKVA